MSKFKVGDWVKIKNWSDFYEVVDVTDCGIKLKIDCAYTAKWYHVDENVFIKKEETMKLEVGGKYRMVGTHEPVRVICTDRLNGIAKYNNCIALRKTGSKEVVLACSINGFDTFGYKVIEEVPEVDWSKVPIDTPIWVGEEPRHFAGFSSHTEEVFYYSSGTTSHTSCNMRYGFSPQFSTHKSNCSLENPNA